MSPTPPQTTRRVLVTGASRGIGRAAMRHLADAGYQVVGLARHAPGDARPDERFVQCDREFDGSRPAVSTGTPRATEVSCADGQAKLHEIPSHGARRETLSL